MCLFTNALFCDARVAGDTVAVGFEGRMLQAGVGAYGNSTVWWVDLPATPASFAAYNITATSATAGSAVQ